MANLDDTVFSERLDLVREKLDDWQVDGLLIGSATNRRWLSGFSGSAGWLVITTASALLATDFRYWDMVRQQAPAFELAEVSGDLDDGLPSLLSEQGIDRLAVEARHLSVRQFDRLAEGFAGQLKKLSATLEPFRETKSGPEIELIRVAARITDLAMAQAPALIRPGMTEREVAWQLEKKMREAGASGLAFDTIVASGPNSARPHHLTGERRLAIGDAIIVDMGAEYDGFKSDLTRTFFLGPNLDARFEEVYRVVHAAQEHALEGLRPGMDGRSADRLARETIEAAGYGDAFGHGLGHGVGLDVHEGPRLSSRAEHHRLLVGNVVTVEPGVYLSGWGGVRIEDLVLMTPKGAESISQCPKRPLIA